MDAYHNLAASYDRLTNDVDYKAIVAFYEEIIRREGVAPRTAVDLACGTGSVTALLAEKGIPVIGVDMSEDMLTVAMQKTQDMKNPPRFICQKLQDLRLARGVDLAVCALDSMDYITDPEDCKKAIARVYKALNPGGIFIFDFNTVYKYEEVIGDATIAENREECSFIWENFYHEEEEINEYDLTVFVQEEGGLFRKFQENHYQRGYRPETIRTLLQEAGLKLIQMIDGDTRGPVTAESERIYVVAGECMK